MDEPGWTDLPIDFGYFGKKQLQESLADFRRHYPNHRMLRHFAIRQDEMNNGLTEKRKGSHER
jgi:hypothetical protein